VALPSTWPVDSTPALTDCPAYVTFTQWPGDTAYRDAVPYTVEFGFNQQGGTCQIPGEVEDGTFQFIRGGHENLTSYFSVGGMQAVGNAVPLNVSASNDMHACFTWIDWSFVEHTQCSSTYSTYMNPTPAPKIDPTPYVFDAQDVGKCAQACFAATASFTTVPYFALGHPQAVTLAYNQDRVDLRPFVFVNVTHPGGDYNTPTQFWLEVQATGTGTDTVTYVSQTFINGETKLHFTGSAQTVRLGGQLKLDAGKDTLTGAYKMKIVVTSQYSGSTQVTTYSTKLIVVNERHAPVARGWTIAGLQHLYLQSDSSVIVTDGAGSAIYFNHPSAGAWTTPLGAFSRLRVVGGAFQRVYPDSTKVTFDNSGRMTGIADRFGNTTSFFYDGSGRLSQIRDPLTRSFVCGDLICTDSLHRRINLAYGTNGLSSIADWSGRTTTVTVNSSKQLTSVADPGGGSTSYGYDDSLRLKSITDRKSNVSKLGFDAWWRVSRDTLPAVSINGGSTASPIVQLSSWQTAGVPLTATGTTAAAPPKADTIHAKMVDPEGNVATFTPDRWGQPLTATNPLGETTTMVYDANGLPARVARPYMAVDSFAYNSDGFRTYARVGGKVTTATEGDWALPSAVGGDGPSVSYHIVTPGTIDRVTVASTVVQTDTVDSRGRKLWTKDASGHTHRFQYDTAFGATGQVVSDSAPSGIVTRFYYDSLGRDTASAVGSLPMHRTHFDGLNRVAASYDSTGATPWTFAYDSLVMVSLTNPRSLTRYQSVNALGWVTATWTSASGSVADSSYYDKNGRVTQHVNRRRQRIHFAYDSLGRVLRHWATDSTGAVTLNADTTTYNDGQLLVGRGNGIVVDTAVADTLGEVVSTAMRLGSGINRRYALAYTYLTSAPYKGLLYSIQPSTTAADTLSKRTFGYNGSLALISLQFGAGITHIGRNLEQRTTVDTLPTASSLRLTQTRSAQEVLSAVTASDAGVNGLVGRNYGLDSLGRIISEQHAIDSTHGRTYWYDRAGRVDSVRFYSAATFGCTWDSIGGKTCTTTSAVDSTSRFTYDALGNRTDQSGVANVLDQLTSFNGHRYTYDADGNLTTDSSGTSQIARYYWSADGLLDTVNAAGTLYLYRYDAGGRLARRYTNGTMDRAFLWDGAKLIAELKVDSAAGTVALLAEYSWYPGLDIPHAVRTAGGVIRYFIQDAQGSITGLTTGGTPMGTLDYDPWGQTAGSANIVNDTIRPRWKGAFNEPGTGLSYLRNRWYRPALGRFISPDPAGLAGGGESVSVR
jgi:RHS repeat-associated protein